MQVQAWGRWPSSYLGPWATFRSSPFGSVDWGLTTTPSLSCFCSSNWDVSGRLGSWHWNGEVYKETELSELSKSTVFGNKDFDSRHSLFWRIRTLFSLWYVAFLILLSCMCCQSHYSLFLHFMWCSPDTFICSPLCQICMAFFYWRVQFTFFPYEETGTMDRLCIV